MDRMLTCIICPRGCSLHVQGEGNELSVSGNACPKGAQYAKDECTHPVRTVTAVVRVANRADTMVSVKTAAPIPKEHIFDLMEGEAHTFVARTGITTLRSLDGNLEATYFGDPAAMLLEALGIEEGSV